MDLVEEEEGEEALVAGGVGEVVVEVALLVAAVRLPKYVSFL